MRAAALRTDTRSFRGGFCGRVSERLGDFLASGVAFAVATDVFLVANAGFLVLTTGFRTGWTFVSGFSSSAMNPRFGLGRLQYGQYSASLGTSVPQRGHVKAIKILL